MSDASIQTNTSAKEAEFGDFFALLKPRVMSLVVFTALVGLLVAACRCEPCRWNRVDPVYRHRRRCIWRLKHVVGRRYRPQNAPHTVTPNSIRQSDRRRCFRHWDDPFCHVCRDAWSCVEPCGRRSFGVHHLLLCRDLHDVAEALDPSEYCDRRSCGCVPPVIGWAVATGGISIDSVLMFALTFAWTPPHFWALALFTKGDYANAGVPMLTVTHGRKATRAHILGYSLVLAVVAVALGLTSIGGPVYMVVALVLNGMFIKGALDVYRRDDEQSDADTHKAERGLFKLSLAYLFLHYGALLVEASLKPFGLGGWG